MKREIKPALLSRSPSFCLLVVFASLGITSHIGFSFIYAIILAMVVVLGSQLLQFLVHSLKLILCISVIVVMGLVFALVPGWLAWMMGMPFSLREEITLSILMSASWVLAYIESSDPRKVAGSFLQGISTIFVFLLIFSLLVLLKIALGSMLINLDSSHFLHHLSSSYWLSMSGTFLLSGLLLLLLQKIELYLWHYSQKY